jgi:type II secretory pathway pseudopilin PulG
MTSAEQNHKIPPAPFFKGGEELAAFSGESAGQPCKLRPAGPCKKEKSFLAICRPSFVPPPSKRAFFLPPLKKGGRGGFSGGFTLVEVIVTIMMAAIMGAFFIQYMGTAMSRSTRSVELVREEATAEAIMERIVTDYLAKINLNENSVLDEMIEAINTNKIYDNSPKKATTKAKFVDFDNNGNEINDSSKLRTLKVMVAAGEHRLTTLLAKSRVNDSPPVPF